MKNFLNISAAFLIITSAFAQVPDSVLRELPDQRTFNSKTYLNTSDNTLVARVSAGYMHYLAGDGRFKDIDTKLKLDKSGAYYVIDSGLYNVAFAAAIGAGNWDVAYEVPRPVHEKFRVPGKSPAPVTRIRWKVLSYGYFDRQRSTYQIIQSSTSVTPVVFGNRIDYPEIFAGIDAGYTCNATSVKEEIVLSQLARSALPDPAKYGLSRNNSYFVMAMEFLLTPNNINVFARRQGNKTPIKQGNNFVFDGDDPIEFEDEHTTLHFFFPKDYAHAMADSITDFANRTSIKRIFYSQGGKNYMLVGVPWSWINSAPAGDLIIDPTTTITNSDDTYLQDATNFGASTSLVIGKSTGSYPKRTIIKFNISGVPGNATVLNAQMKLRYYGISGTPWIDRWVQAHQLLRHWREGEADSLKRRNGSNWLEPRGKIGSGSDSTLVDANGQYESRVLFQTGEYPVWKNWDLTALTQKWINGTATNYGVILWADFEENGMNLWFRSSEYSDPAYRPQLEIIYSTELKTVYFLKDHLGSVRAAVLDSTGAPVIGFDDYDAWGYPLAARSKPIPNAYLQGGSKIKFTGKEYDDEYEVNLGYWGRRYYDWLTGRWISVDPLAEKYPSLSPYNYSANNPIVNYDRDGQIIDTIVDAVSIAYDVYDIARTVVQGKEVSKTQYAALGADVAGLLLPGATGLGAAVRTASKIDEVADVARAADKVADVTKGMGKVADAGRGLTSAEKGIFDKIDRIKIALDPKHINAAIGDLKGKPILDSSGKPFDHLKEVRNAQQGLGNQIEKLKKTLSDPNLSQEARKQIEQKLGETSKFLDETEKFVTRGSRQ